MLRFTVFAAILVLGACGEGGDPDGGPPPPDTGAPSDAGGQEPDAGVDGCAELTLPPLRTEELVPGHAWNAPLFVTQPAGSDALFVLEQGGRIQLVRGTSVTTFLDITDRIRAGGERGLLGLAFHPDYASNGRFFIYYTPASPDNNRVAEYRRSAADPDVADPTEVAVLVDIDDPEANHNGGMIAFGPDGFLYVGTGDGGGGGDRHPPFGNGLSLDTLMGKLLRLDVDAAAEGYAAPGNPFAGGGGLPQIWAYGLRNPWRFSFDRATGDLYIGDVGQSMWEEIDIQPRDSVGGENYGWRAYEGFEIFSAPDLDRAANHVEPALVFSHSGDAVIEAGCSVTGGYVYRGSAIPGLVGWYLYGDYCSAQRGAFRVCDGEVAGLQEVEGLRGAAGNLASWGEDQAGELYLAGSTVLRVVP